MGVEDDRGRSACSLGAAVKQHIEITFRSWSTNLRRATLEEDCIEGEDLRCRTARQPPTVNKVVAQEDAVRDALAYLHSRRPPVIHRDLEPPSLGLQPDATIVLVDFGIAKVSDRQQASTGARGLTPGFSPPEQSGGTRTDASGRWAMANFGPSP